MSHTDTASSGSPQRMSCICLVLILRLSVRVSMHPDGTLPTFTGNQIDPEAFSLSHSGLEDSCGKRQLSAVGRHNGKLRRCVEGE